MNISLNKRIKDCQEILEGIQAKLGKHPGKLPRPLEEYLEEATANIKGMEYWISTLNVRNEALSYLKELESNANNQGVHFGTKRVPFQVGRMIGTQAYLSQHWALSDLITGFIGTVLCRAELGNHNKESAKLVTDFVTGENNKNNILTPILKSIQPAFGWPICISYALRNCLVHEGGLVDGISLFAGTTVEAGFGLNEVGWIKVEANARMSKPDPKEIPPHWPSNPITDLRDVFSACEQSMDEALGVLLGTASHLLKAHTALMVGEI